MSTRLLHLAPGLTDAARDVVSELLMARDSLPLAANNRPPVPASSYARYALEEVQAQRGPVYKGLEHVLALSFANIDLGMSLSEAKRWLRRCERYIDVHAAERHLLNAERVTPIGTAFRRETKAVCAFDCAELRVMANSQDADALKSAIETGNAQIVETASAVTACEYQLARVTLQGAGQQTGELRA